MVTSKAGLCFQVRVVASRSLSTSPADFCTAACIAFAYSSPVGILGGLMACSLSDTILFTPYRYCGKSTFRRNLIYRITRPYQCLIEVRHIVTQRVLMPPDRLIDAGIALPDEPP